MLQVSEQEGIISDGDACVQELVQLDYGKRGVVGTHGFVWSPAVERCTTSGRRKEKTQETQFK